MIANPICSNKSGSGNSFTVPTPFEVGLWESPYGLFDHLIGDLASQDDTYTVWEKVDPKNFMVAIMIENDGDLEEIRYATMGDLSRATLIGPVRLDGKETASLVEFIFWEDGTVEASVLTRETDDTGRTMRPNFYIKRKRL